MKTRFEFGGLVSVVVSVGALLLASCSTTASPAMTETPTTDAKPYGSLVVGLPEYTGYGRVDPKFGTGNTFQTIGAQTFDSLVELTTDAQPRPGLAERWEISADGKTHTFYIRKGVKFHDGSDLTGADVKFSIERFLAPDTTHPDAAVWRAQVASVVLADSHTVALNLKQPQFELLKGLESFSGVGAVVPKKYVEEKGVDYFGGHPLGSGPWRVANFIPGDRLDLEAVESHWRATPKFKNLTVLEVKNEASKVAMLKTGELDMAHIAPDSAAALKSAGLRVFSFDGGAGYLAHLFYDVEHPDQYALGDVRVRKALSLAVNRQEMADKLVGGYGAPLATLYAPPTSFFFDPNVLKPDPYDSEGAKKLLTEAGYANGFSMKIWDQGKGSLLSTLNLAIAGYWRKLGINAEVVPVESSVLSSMRHPKHKPEVWNTAAGGMSGGGIMQFEGMLTVYHSTKGVFHNHTNKRLDELIDKVPLTKDPAEKRKLALEAAVLATNQYSSLQFIRLLTAVAVGPKIGTVTPIKNVVAFAAVYETLTHAK